MKTKIFLTAAAVLLSASLGLGSCKKVKKSSEKAIVEFWVNGVQYQISGTNITYMYPKISEDVWTGYPAMPIAPSKVVISPGAKLDPPATTARDFVQEQIYTVIAEDGTRQTYRVKAERVPYVD